MNGVVKGDLIEEVSLKGGAARIFCKSCRFPGRPITSGVRLRAGGIAGIKKVRSGGGYGTRLMVVEVREC